MKIIINHLICKGAVMLSPQGIAHVCKGDQLELTCTTTMNTVLDWIIAIPGNATNLRRSVSTSSVLTVIPLNSARLIFSRTSEVNSDPLVSTLLISTVGDGLNGTEVDCMVGVTTLSTVVNIISDKNLTIGTYNLNGDHDSDLSCYNYGSANKIVIVLEDLHEHHNIIIEFRTFCLSP